MNTNISALPPAPQQPIPPEEQRQAFNKRTLWHFTQPNITGSEDEQTTAPARMVPTDMVLSQRPGVASLRGDCVVLSI